ncbi:hypothetical protein BDZ45DRAFT_735012 [Acephala macrosclerotiorum]|nr:hypothetical protein BDZ45DRAFT_735012 [Acephala macrosclerotiorum]
MTSPKTFRTPDFLKATGSNRHCDLQQKHVTYYRRRTGMAGRSKTSTSWRDLTLTFDLQLHMITPDLLYHFFRSHSGHVITSVTTSTVRKLWFQRFVLFTAECGSLTQSRIKVLVGLGDFKDQLGQWQVVFTFTLISLITTSIVAGLTPRSITYVSDSNLGKIYILVDKYCLSDVGIRSVSGQWFPWTLHDGSNITYDQNLATPNGRVQGVWYIMGDVLVFQCASGVPWSYKNGLDDVFGTTWNSDFLWAFAASLFFNEIQFIAPLLALSQLKAQENCQ